MEADTQTKTEERPKRHWWILVVAILFCAVLIGLAIAYWRTADYYKTHFFPRVTVNGMDCGGLDAQAVSSLIEAKAKEYTLQVVGQDGEALGVLGAEDVGLAVDVAGDVENLLQSQEAFHWLRVFLRKEAFAYDLVYSTSFDPELMKASALKWDGLKEVNMERPKDAYLTEYLPEKKAFEIVPETKGSLLDLDKVGTCLEEAVRAGEASIDLDAAGCYIRAAVTSQDKDLLERAEELNRLVGTRITYDWNGTQVVLDGDTILGWIVEEDGKFSIDEEAVAEFVETNAKANDTYGKKRKFTTIQGTTLTLLSGAYGWKTDRERETEELLSLIEEGAQVDREPVYLKKGWHKGVEDDIGPSYVEIDLTNQHLYLFMDGKVVLESDFVSGLATSQDRITPPGVFGITYKTQNATLRGANYESHVNYWMPFNGNIGMHDATWRSSFGGDIYLTNGSHGCINLPLSKAKEIYGYMEECFPVICYYY